jgi:hypothetical protein
MEDILQITLELLAATFSFVVALFLMKATNRSQRWEDVRLVSVPAHSQLQKFTVTDLRGLSDDISN